MQIDSNIQSYGQTDPESSRESRLTYSNWVDPESTSMINSRTSEFGQERIHDQGLNSYNPPSTTSITSLSQIKSQHESKMANELPQTMNNSNQRRKRKNSKAYELDRNSRKIGKTEKTTRSDKNTELNKSYFENMCDYVEIEQNYSNLFGDCKKTQLGTGKNTFLQEFGHFEKYLNLNNKKGSLNLDS
ncbi:hypothetical protein O181_116482 [Austropuccinia psidii MF-1]|uniref:Uncharacterized protein n=1 Tax=Austropuccinia psidii MF-1 TaxID=1389203 RepID=A0A9Q3KBI0_9BASI|nr:hypothetical protein [Austropuccinia psidii MF-1]